MLEETIVSAKEVRIRQRKELAELFGFETRNKYEIRNQNDDVIGYAAEQGKGFMGSLSRYFMGHWRRYEITVFNNNRQEVLKLVHPFRWFFQRIEVFTANGVKIGSLQQRFAFFHKRFDYEDATNQMIFEVRSPLWKPWTFPVTKTGEQVALIKKRWSGFLREAITDSDNFSLEFLSSRLSSHERWLILASGFFVDLQYFEKKANSD